MGVEELVDLFVEFLVREVASSGWNAHARIRVLAPRAEVLARINPAVGVVEAAGDDECVLVTGADSVETIAADIGMLGRPFRVTGPPELIDAGRVLGERYGAATSSS